MGKVVSTRSDKYTVIVDDREKPDHGWVFLPSSRCAGCVTQRLKTGDYTLQGYENILCIERKGSLKELVTNLHQSRFQKTLERMSNFEVAVVILEFTFEDLCSWPANCPIPLNLLPSYMTIPGAALAAFWKIKIKYPNVNFIFAGTCGREAASSLFKRIVEKYEKNEKK